MLDLAVVLTLAQTCAPQAAPQTLAAIAHAESRFDALAIGVNCGPRSARRPQDRADAVRIARDLLARGADLDLGLAQINSGNLAWLGLTVETAFDPCRNLAAAARALSSYRPTGDRPSDRQAALRIALSRFNTGRPDRGFYNGYVARVEASAAQLGLTAPQGAVLARGRAPFPVSPPTPLRGGGRPRLRRQPGGGRTGFRLRQCEGAASERGGPADRQHRAAVDRRVSCSVPPGAFLRG